MLTMAEFLADNNACGQNLLRIVSMGNSLIAEILRMKDYIPDIYYLSTKADQQKYGDILLDFSYLQVFAAHEKKIEQSPELQDLDDEVRENYLELLSRFYLIFESTYQYAEDLTQYIDELGRGYYIQQSVETVLQDGEGKQLLCEALYLFGVMLLLIDYHIPGLVRERLLISYYRYGSSKAHSDSHVDDVCMLLRSTGFVVNTSPMPAASNKLMTVPHYPEAYFARYKFDANFVDMVIGRLRCDDIYNQLSVYPHPDHRSTALSTQASMLFVCLFFSPKTLHSQVAQMREIVDKFYADNWMICIYMGMTVNLIDAWHKFNAAEAALTHVFDTVAVRGFCLLHRERMEKTIRQTKDILRDGVLTDEFVLQKIGQIIICIRQCNVLLRWYITHTSKAVLDFGAVPQKVQQVLQYVCSELRYNPAVVFELLLNCSQLELAVKEILRSLMEEKSTRWEHFKRESLERINELGEVFAGTRPLAKVTSNLQLKAWFAEIATHIENLDAENPNTAGRTLIQLIEAIEEVQEFHNLQANMHVKQYLIETCEYLHRMIQIIHMKEDVLINLQLIGDFSYAWCLLEREFTPIMQEAIKKQPKAVIRLRAVFLKLASALEIPLLRINQAKSEDLETVSKYYSNNLANFMRKVLQIIPETMFSLLSSIIHLQTDVLKEIPTRLDKDKLREYAQFEERFQVAKLTSSIAVFTEGILMMKKTLVGVIELDPKQLLEDGIRKELVCKLSDKLNTGLIFTPVKNKNPTAMLETKLLELTRIMDGYRRSFEYVQDYLSIHGLKILQEEVTRIINYNVEKECNAFLRNKVQDWQSPYQSRTIPIPSFPPLQGDATKSNNFFGRLAREIISCTDPKHTSYVDLKATWYEKRPPNKEVLTPCFFTKVREAIGPAGLVGLDRLYAYLLIADLERNITKMQKNIANDKMWTDALNGLSAELEAGASATTTAPNPTKFYAGYHTRWLKVWPTILEWLLKTGHLQILRQQITIELNQSSKCNSKNYVSALETFNKALLLELQCKEPTPQFKEHGNELIAELNDYLKFVGAHEPLEEVFVTTRNPQHIALFLFLFTVAHVPRLQFSTKTQTLLAKVNKDIIDGHPLMLGILTVLQQFHSSVKILYVTYLCQFATTLINASLSANAKKEIPADAVTTLHFLKAFTRCAQMPRSLLTEHIPVIILNQFTYLAKNIKS